MKIYQKYIPEGQEIQAIIHQHWLSVIDSFILWISFGAIIPVTLYYQSERLRDIIPFVFMEVFLILVFIKILYELFNWYLDVWILTDQGVYDLEWSLLKSNLESISYGNIEGVEIDKHRIWDSIFNKGDIIIHKFGEEELAIYNAYSPYKAANIIENFIAPVEEEEEDDKFDIVMDTLSHVVKDYLERTHLPDEKVSQKKDFDPDYTLDLSK